jgi:hypothetical protein
MLHSNVLCTDLVPVVVARLLRLGRHAHPRDAALLGFVFVKLRHVPVSLAIHSSVSESTS